MIETATYLAELFIWASLVVAIIAIFATAVGQIFERF